MASNTIRFIFPGDRERVSDNDDEMGFSKQKFTDYQLSIDDVLFLKNNDGEEKMYAVDEMWFDFTDGVGIQYVVLQVIQNDLA